ncbi:unnamed protein product [Urochloa humidicola]
MRGFHPPASREGWIRGIRDGSTKAHGKEKAWRRIMGKGKGRGRKCQWPRGREAVAALILHGVDSCRQAMALHALNERWPATVRACGAAWWSSG